MSDGPGGKFADAKGVRPIAAQRKAWLFAAALAVLMATGLWYWQRALAAALLIAEPTALERDARLDAYAIDMARPLYATHCASCHGASMQGDSHRGAPNLKDSIWLYGDGGIGDIEATILYGVRSGHPKARNVTDMPAIGRTHQLAPAEVSDVVEFVLSLGKRAEDAAAVERGSKLFFDKGNCYDCHAGDAEGNSDYGAPALTGKVWNWGGDRRTLYESVYNGRHGLCPAWINTLRPVQIRALAVYLYSVSHRGAQLARNAKPGDFAQ